MAFPGTAHYAASKAAVVGYSHGAAPDLGRRNITVNVVAGGDHGYRHVVGGARDRLPPFLMESHVRRFADLVEWLQRSYSWQDPPPDSSPVRSST
ncbi:SDR family NAD(P)-dependent oxidoreductase [Bradyrhizobium sp. USDA 329]|uniref:SDR family NAD(P)-dependent oxidoreductase n=1 Tax=unclassified Bradyrhizobium TaxID=2631580 RepID=UPI003512C256